MSGYDYSILADDELRLLFKQHGDMADENDDEGGHVGISRHHRRRADEIGEEMRRRGI